MTEDRERWVARALELGATDAVIFTPDEIAFDARALLKCMFGCGSWGKGPTCPSRPGSLRPWEWEPILRKYSWGVLVHAPDKKTSYQVARALEGEAFVDGKHLAFAMSDCAGCADCVGEKGQPCADVRHARPAMQGAGIDVFATAHGFGLPIRTLADREEQPQDWYSSVWME
jgi:predicted metal-binding protein